MSGRVDVVAGVIALHYRRDVGSCACGWGEATGDLGRSHAAHVAELALAAADRVTAAAGAPEVLEWKHPYLGNIVETLCSRHAREVLRALTALGIGCGGRYARPGDGGCTRCLHDGAAPTSWLRQLVGKPGLLS